MKALRFLSLGILTALVLFAGLGLLLPAQYTIEEYIEIEAEPTTIFPLITELEQWKQWAFEGTSIQPANEDKTVYAWEDETGRGSITINDSEMPVSIQATIATGDNAFESKSTFSLKKENDGFTTVVWKDTQNLKYNFIARYYAFFSNYKANIAQTYQQGLKKLKSLAESHQGTGYITKEVLLDSTVSTWQNATLILQKMPPLTNKIVAEVAAKGGFLSRKMAQSADTVISLQTEKAHVALANRQNTKAAINNIKVRLTGLISPAIYEKEVDVVLCSYAFSLLEDPTTYFERIKRGLQTQGDFYALEFIKNPPQGYPVQALSSPESIIQSLKEAGFNKIEIFDISENQRLFHARE